MSSWHSYPSIYNLGHGAIAELFNHPVIVEEKIDGSQFSFGLFEEGLKVRSKGCTLFIDAPEKMFTLACESVKSRAHLLHPGWTYRAEYLAKPKHNTLAYNRIPRDHLIIFDICTEEESYLDYIDKQQEASRIGLETVPMLGILSGDCLTELRKILDTTQSILGASKIEGIVCKQLKVHLYGRDKKALMGKFVSENFKEIHNSEWKKSNPSQKDIIELIGATYNSQPRWHKAIQHLNEAGKLTNSVKDIGPLIKEIPQDILKECEEEIKETLFKSAWPHIARTVIKGFPEFYKELLMKKQFE